MIVNNLDIALFMVNNGVHYEEVAQDLGIDAKKLERAFSTRELNEAEIYAMKKAILRIASDHKRNAEGGAPNE